MNTITRYFPQIQKSDGKFYFPSMCGHFSNEKEALSAAQKSAKKVGAISFRALAVLFNVDNDGNMERA